MKINGHATRAAVFLFSFLMSLSVSTGVWASDAEDDEGAKQDTTSKTEDAAAEGTSHFDPPHDEHVNSAPEHPAHQSGASVAGGASLAEAATDPSAVLTQFQNFFWTKGSSDNKNISNTYLLQPVLPLSKNNVLRPALRGENPISRQVRFACPPVQPHCLKDE